MKKRSAKNIFAAIVFLLAVAGCADDSPEQQVRSAIDYLQKNDAKAASIQLKNALQKNPDLPDARFLLGTILLREKNATAAQIEFRKALAAKHPDSLVVPELARAMLMLGHADKLVEEFGKVKFDKSDADASLQTTLGAAYNALGKPDLAAVAWNAALKADPSYAPALIERARRKAADRDYVAALAAAEEVITKNPGNAEAWKLKGDILFYAFIKTEDALTAYRKAIEFNPRWESAHIAVLTALMEQGKLSDTEKQLEQLKLYSTNSLQTKYFEAQLAYQKKDYRQARELAQQILKFAPNNPRVLQLAGKIELQMDSLVQAENYLVKATQSAPELVLAHRLLVMTYLRSGQPAKALTALNSGNGKEGLDPELFPLAGEVYLQNGDANLAEEYFTKALKLDPGNVGKRTALAVAHLATGHAAAAFDELTDIAGSDRGSIADLALISAYLRRSEFAKALVAIDKLEAKQPGRPFAANLRGRIQIEQKDATAARKSFERALAIDSSYFAAAAGLAALDLADKKPDDARKRFENLLAKNPKNGLALMSLAQLAILRGAEKGEVVGLLSKAVEANPYEVAPRLQLIDLFLKNNNMKEALDAAQVAVTALPSSPDLLGALGRVHQVSGDVNQAITTYRKLIALQPLSPQPHIRLAEAYVANKNSGAAEQSLRKALEIQPGVLDAQRALIILALEAKKYQDAVKVARTIQEQRPKDQLGFLLEGDVALVQKDWAGAAAAYRSGLRRTSSSELATKLHSVLIASGNNAESDKFAGAWLKEHPRDGAFLMRMGDLAISRNDFSAAEKYYLSLLQSQPDSPLALNNLAWVTARLRKDGAIDYAEKANKLAPNHPAFMDTWAMLLAEKNEYARSLALLTKAVELQPSNAQLRLNLAKIYIKVGDKIRAKAELDSLAWLGDKFAAQAEVSALLKSL